MRKKMMAIKPLMKLRKRPGRESPLKMILIRQLKGQGKQRKVIKLVFFIKSKVC